MLLASLTPSLLMPLINVLAFFSPWTSNRCILSSPNYALSIFDSFTFDASDQRPCFLFTMDVKSLYTVIPNDGGLQALSYFLDQRTIKEPSTHTLVRPVLTLNAFSFDDQHYRQIGVAMGSKMGPNYACLFVGYSEERIRSAYTGFVPQLHKRYIDDVVGAAQCSRLELDDFINYVSNFHPALQFTSNISDLELLFLDIKLKINNYNIQTSVHYKATDTHNYLHHFILTIASRQFPIASFSDFVAFVQITTILQLEPQK